LAAVLIASIMVLQCGAAVFAQTSDQGISLQVSPLPISLSTKPGTTITSDLRIRNVASKTEKLQVRLLKVKGDDTASIHLTEPTSADEWAKWVSFSRPTFDAPPGEWQTIKMTVNVPKTAAFGYYFAVEYLRASQEAPVPEKTVTQGAVATFVLLNAEAPGATREAQITEFTADKKFYEFLPASFKVKVRSSGNVHVVPHGNIFINRGSKQVGVINVNADQGSILPQSSRYFEAAWSDGFPVYTAQTKDDQPVLDKTGRPVNKLQWDFSHANRLRYGHYTAHLVLIYDNGQRDVPLEATVSFWVVPWRIIGVVLGLAVIIIGLITYTIVLRRRLKRPKVYSARRRGK